MGKLAGNFEIWNKDSVNPGNKPENKKKHSNDSDRNPRIAFG